MILHQTNWKKICQPSHGATLARTANLLKVSNLNDMVGVLPVHASDWIKDLCSLKDNLQPIKLTEAFAPDLLAEELRLVNCS